MWLMCEKFGYKNAIKHENKGRLIKIFWQPQVPPLKEYTQPPLSLDLQLLCIYGCNCES